ncbi:sporozoite surface protein 3, putative [Hepatocystis sp. ex Piliocolobus tephrosceles]|nr:sporozoite surface protein 3, putative [Hepatocystis sp. ex Piliocolobus tephrosceles]
MLNLFYSFFFLFWFYFGTVVKNDSFVCDFSTQIYSAHYYNTDEDIICSRDIGHGDSIAVIMPKEKDGNEMINIKTKCFDDISLDMEGESVKLITEVFNKDQIDYFSFIDEDNTYIYNVSLLYNKNITKSEIIHCVFEVINANEIVMYKGIAKINMHNRSLKDAQRISDNNNHFINLYYFKKVPDLGDNTHTNLKVRPGDSLYIVYNQIVGNFVYFNKECNFHFKGIGLVYRHDFPIVNEEEYKYNTCNMYYISSTNQNIKIASFDVTLMIEKPSIININKDLLTRYMLFDVEINLKRLIAAITYDVTKFKDKKYIDNEISISPNFHSKYYSPSSCNNDTCVNYFKNAMCSASCGKGYLIKKWLNFKTNNQMVIPCEISNCNLEDKNEPLVISLWSLITMCIIMVGLFFVMLYDLIGIYKRPEKPYTSKVYDKSYIHKFNNKKLKT